MERVNEIQQKIQQFQPAKVKEFQEYYTQMLSKDHIDSDSSTTTNPTEPDPIHSITQNKPENTSKQNKYGDDFSNLIKDASQKYAVPEDLIKAVI